MRAGQRLAAIAAACVFFAAGAPAGEWITPDMGDAEPQRKPVPLFWFVVKDCPLIYHREVTVPASADRATALLRTSGYAYVYVDGELVYSWTPRPAVRRGKQVVRPGVPADPTQVHKIDLTAGLTPGKHVLAVSAPAKGFVLDGGIYAATKRLARLATDTDWRVAKLAPTTILPDEAPVLRAGYRGAAFPVKADVGFAAAEDDLAAAHYAAALVDARVRFADLLWQTELLAGKGIYIHDDAAFGWAGPAGLRRRCPAVGQADVSLPVVQIRDSLSYLLSRRVATVKDLRALLGEIRKLTAQLDAAAGAARKASEACFRADERLAMRLASRIAGLKRLEAADPADARKALEAHVRHPLNRLDQTRYDRLGWIDHPHLVDSDLARWGVRVNPVTGPTRITAGHRWRFQLDAKDVGLSEQRHTMGYNIDNQWPTIDGQRTWTADGRFRGYKGVAWYRNPIRVPAEWAGGEVVLATRIAGRWRAWLNDREITSLGKAGGGGLTFRLPPDAVAFGAANLLAVRVEADGRLRGLTGPVVLNCPALDAASAGRTPPVDVLATPLSPCVLLTPRTKSLEVHHGGRQALLRLPALAEARAAYDAARDGKLKQNWILLKLAPANPAGPERDILLVFRRNPKAIEAAPGVVTVRFEAAGERVIAVRPVAKGPADPKADPGAKVKMWSRAALAIPVDFFCVTKVLQPGEPYEGISIRKVPRGPVLSHTYAYDYLVTADEWRTEPLKLAPLPALCSFAIDCKYRTLKLDKPVEDLQDGGLLAGYRGLSGTDRIGYSYQVEPFPRMVGFTSWMFAGGDAGVTGNTRELELMAYAGANSFRPQHNWSDEPPPKGMFLSGDKRTRVQILADCCRAVGVNYLNNPDQRLNQKRETIRADYAKFIGLYHEHYRKIATQLADRPFWAVGYDLINEPFDHKTALYNPAMKALTAAIRKIDPRHLLYVEPPEAWGSINHLQRVVPTGDPLTVYSFHDYEFRLRARAAGRQAKRVRWPSASEGISHIYRRWLPAMIYQIRHGVCIHCGEFGGFGSDTDAMLAQKTLLNDVFRVFDQFGMHSHYYTGRGVFARLSDGGLRPSNVVRAYRAQARRKDFNLYYKRWQGHPRP